MKFRSSSGCIGLNSVCLYVGVGIYKQIYRGSPSDCESVREIFHPLLAEADPTKPYIECWSLCTSLHLHAISCRVHSQCYDLTKPLDLVP